MCSIGEHVGDECSAGVKVKEDFSPDDWKLLKLRSGRSILRNVCEYHKMKYLNLYEKRQTLCCNPLPNRHNQKPAKGSKTINLSMYRKAKGTLALVPGKKLCITCYKSIWELVGGEEEIESSQSIEPTPENSQEVHEDGQGVAVVGGIEGAGIQRQEAVAVVEGIHAVAEQGPLVVQGTEEPIVVERNAAFEGEGNGPAANLMGSPSLPYLLRQRTAHFSKPSSPSSTGTAQASSVSSPGFVPFEEVLSTLNKALKKLGASEVNKDKLRSRAFYGSHQLEEIQAAIHTFLQNHAGDHEVLIPFKDDSDNFLQILNLLKEKFNSSSSISERVLVLSVLPPSWSRLKIRTEFGSQATNYVISLTKSLVEKHGPFVTPGRKHGRPLSEATVQAVIKFYELDEISSKLMPGCKDYVSVIEDGKRVQKQKRLLLSNLESLYETYKSTHGEENPISFSKFAKLRPKHCVLAGSPGTHSVCVCIYHENVSLMFEGGRFKQASANEAKPLIDFKDCLNELICEEKRPECYLRQCKQCPSGDDLKLRLKRLLNDELMLTSVTYRGWFKVTGRYHLEKVIKPVDDFVEDFMALLFKLLPHHLITKKQSAYYQKVKENLKEGEALIVCDFAENYSCVVQNEVQGYHWTNEQVTIHPFVAYYRDQTGELKSVSYASVTDHKKHMTSTFHAFQKKFVPFLTRKMAEDNITLNKLFYFSDGASAQYKNKKNILNICLHEKDFKIKIEWHFFASCHGKGPCDGVGGCLKRYAARASLQGTIIRNAHEFCEWAKHLPNITTEYLSIEEIEEHILEQAQRAEGLQVVSGIATFHAAIPDSESTVLLKRYSESPHHVIMPLFQTRYFVPWDSLQEYVLVARENTWWVAKIVEKINETNEIRVSYMTPSGRARAYSWPAIIDEATIHWRYILAITVPVIRKNVFTIPVLDKNKADRELKLYKEMNGAGMPLPETEDDRDPDDPDGEEENPIE